MLKTELGTIKVLVDGQNCNYHIEELSNTQSNYCVDKRYKLTVPVPTNTSKVVVECALTDFMGDKGRGGVESGQQLALISFYRGNIKLSLGTEDEIPHVHSGYTDYGLNVTIDKEADLKQVVFGVAWIAMKDEEKEDIYTWFAADPTFHSVV